MYMQKLYYLVISAKTIWYAHSTLHKTIDYVQKIEREFCLLKNSTV